MNFQNLHKTFTAALYFLLTEKKKSFMMENRKLQISTLMEESACIAEIAEIKSTPWRPSVSIAAWRRATETVFARIAGRRPLPALFIVSAPIPAGMQKSKIAAGLLGIFLGSFGVHNFYLGYTGKAVAQLILTIAGFFTAIFIIGIFAALAASIWGLVEGIMILCGGISTDGAGIPLKD